MTSRFLVTLALAACVFSPLSGALRAEPQGGLRAAELAPAWTEADGRRVAALRLSLAPGWKTYWRVPGVGGIPPAFDWSGSRNVAGIEPLWPKPRLFDIGGITVIGYEGHVVLPFRVTPKDPERPVHLVAKVELGVCSEICMPEELLLRAVLPPETGARPADVAAALADLPYSATEAGVEAVDCESRMTDAGQVEISARVRMPSAGAPEALVIEAGDPDLWIAQDESRRKGQVIEGSAQIFPETGRTLAIGRDDIRITVIGTDRAVEIEGCDAP